MTEQGLSAVVALAELVSRCRELDVCLRDQDANGYDGATTRSLWRQSIERAESLATMSWTEEPPTQPGYYWAYERENEFFPHRRRCVCLVDVRESNVDGRTLRLAWIHAQWHSLYDYSHWLGPLSAPVVPVPMYQFA